MRKTGKLAMCETDSIIQHGATASLLLIILFINYMLNLRVFRSIWVDACRNHILSIHILHFRGQKVIGRLAIQLLLNIEGVFNHFLSAGKILKPYILFHFKSNVLNGRAKRTYIVPLSKYLRTALYVCKISLTERDVLWPLAVKMEWNGTPALGFLVSDIYSIAWMWSFLKLRKKKQIRVKVLVQLQVQFEVQTGGMLP